MRKSLVCSCVLLVGFASAPCSRSAERRTEPDRTPASYLNSELPCWIKFSAEERLRVETLHDVQFGLKDNTYLLERLRLNLIAAPTESVRLVLQAQDARVFFTTASPPPATQQDPIDLRIGYLEIGDRETRAVTLRAGRQGLDFGEGRLVADPNWSNVGRSFDALRLTFRSHRMRIDAFTGISDKIFIDGFATPTPGEHFDGLYASFDKLVPKAVVEPYFFWKMEHKVRGEIIKTGNLDEKTAGLRWVGEIPNRVDYGIESAWQRGSYATEPISAWASHLMLRYTFRDSKHAPKIWGEFNRGSGDGNAKDGIHHAFDTLYPSSHDKFGAADQFCWTNLTHARAGVQYSPAQKLTLGAAENWFWLTNRRDGIYSSGKVSIASNGAGGAFIGHEPDLQAKWKMSRQTQVDLAAGHIFAGSFLQATHHRDLNSVVIGLTQGF